MENVGVVEGDRVEVRVFEKVIRGEEVEEGVWEAVAVVVPVVAVAVLVIEEL